VAVIVVVVMVLIVVVVIVIVIRMARTLRADRRPAANRRKSHAREARKEDSVINANHCGLISLDWIMFTSRARFMPPCSPELPLKTPRQTQRFSAKGSLLPQVRHMRVVERATNGC
jgi:hypothetical protein